MNPYNPRIYMIRAHVDIARLDHWIDGRQIFRRKPRDLGFAMHMLLTEIFGESAPRPYLIKNRRGSAYLALYGYSPSTAEQLTRNIDEFAAPNQIGVIKAMESKPMPATFECGRTLGYEIRARPTERRERVEIDTATLQAERALERGENPPTQQQAYASWLALRLQDNGAKMIDAKILRANLAWAVRNNRSKPKIGPAATISGHLQIMDPKKFAQAIARGIGRHKAYGYGMLMIHPPQRRPADWE